MPKNREKMANPFGGAPGAPAQHGFLGIGNPNGAQINFNQDELEAELSDLLGTHGDRDLSFFRHKIIDNTIIIRRINLK